MAGCPCGIPACRMPAVKIKQFQIELQLLTEPTVKTDQIFTDVQASLRLRWTHVGFVVLWLIYKLSLYGCK